MPLQQHHIDELKRIYEARFGTSLTNEEAWAMGTRLLHLFQLITNHQHASPKKSYRHLRPKI